MSDVVGQRFKAWDGHVYVCDSYDPRIGYWMTREDAPDANKTDTEGTWRRNVSERVIVPEPVAKLLRLCVKLKLTPEDVK